MEQETDHNPFQEQASGECVGPADLQEPQQRQQCFHHVERADDDRQPQHWHPGRQGATAACPSLLVTASRVRLWSRYAPEKLRQFGSGSFWSLGDCFVLLGGVHFSFRSRGRCDAATQSQGCNKDAKGKRKDHRWKKHHAGGSRLADGQNSGECFHFHSQARIPGHRQKRCQEKRDVDCRSPATSLQLGPIVPLQPMFSAPFHKKCNQCPHVLQHVNQLKLVGVEDEGCEQPRHCD
mmetsp:Transcript_86556/g.190028  ORF Transcript_86556/g.190028 Transcript_86556/m.190028 type:complete len:236 (+) Transcript_86556:356-1063(+)